MTIQYLPPLTILCRYRMSMLTFLIVDPAINRDRLMKVSTHVLMSGGESIEYLASPLLLPEMLLK
jgi:hypothetical protein